LPKAAESSKSERRICVVCKELVGEDILNEDVLCIIALAQRLALAGGKVTILWVPKERPSIEEIENATVAYRDKYSIKVDLYEHADETIYKSNLANHVSLGIYTYLKKHNYSAAYIPLEGGLAYYTLLGKETGVYDSGPKINVIATAPLEWSFNSDRYFYWSIDQLKIDFMEKYCAQQADKLICTSAPLCDWLKEKKWKLSPDCETLPALVPIEWNEQPYRHDFVAANGAREIILIASPHFRDGITLFCDVLDHLNSLTSDDLTITVLGGFYRILGEHTGGMFVRRGRRWKFRLRFMRNLSLREGLLYAKEVRGVAVIPNFENAGGYGVAECIRLGVPFVATSVGGNVEQAKFVDMVHSLVKPEAKVLAVAILGKLKKPVPFLTNKFEDQKFQAWLKVLSKTKKGDAPLNRKTARKSSSPLVSVIMTHHDRPQFFLQALESIREQDYPNFEVIVVDDGSALPESHAMLDGLKSEFKRRKWKIIKTANRYVGAARNTGVRASRGKFIVFVDDDNALLPQTVSTFVAAVTRSNSDVCTALSRNFYGQHVPGSNKFNYVGWIPLGASPDVSFLESCFGDTISIYRRTVFNKVGFQLEKFGYMVEDYEFFVRIMLSGLKIRLIPEPLFWYRVSTQGRYRSSHFYDNQLPILEAFSKSKFNGLDNLYKLVLGQNISAYTKDSYKANLSYSPSDREFLELCELDPNGRDAISLLAKLAAGESRPDTAMGLLASLGVSNFETGLDDILKGSQSSSTSMMNLLPVFTSTKTLGVSDLLVMQVSSEQSGEDQPKSYVEKPGQIFVESVNGLLSVAVLAAGAPAHTIDVSAQISSQDNQGDDLEFLLLLCPMHEDPVVAVQSARREQSEASSGWAQIGSGGIPPELVARFSTPSLTPFNLVLALRSRGSDGLSAVGRFDSISVKMALEERVGRPRLGPLPRGNQGRNWTNAERISATLVTDYPSELPQLLFPKGLEDGIFIRPSTHGPVVAAIYGGFPAFAKRLLGQVEIAHEEASAFEFAVALTLPDEDLEWRASGPKNSVGFSGWLRVEEKFKLHDINIMLMEQMNSPLTISLAIRLPRGSDPLPANAFWRSLKFFWEE
jgi:glycosyltransferase involved in cell wall biosynthesis